MLSLSQTTGYAIVALGVLGTADDEWMLARTIARRTGVPLSYLSKILHALRRAGMIRAKPGYRGGFLLAQPAEKVSLLDVAEAIEGPDCIPDCMLGLSDCSVFGFCPTHDFWVTERRRIEKELKKWKLSDVADYVRRAQKDSRRGAAKRRKTRAAAS